MPRKDGSGPKGNGPKKVNRGTPTPRRSGNGINKRGATPRRGGNRGKRG